MNVEQLRALKTDEVHSELERLRRHYFDLRSQAVTEKLEDPAQLRETRRSIARVLTVLRQRNEKNIEQQQDHLVARAAHRK
ncbi:MAG: 50S ribosomal protein L29 [Phycisphaerae bacterium]|jgi:large subunit ribosomal protein L29